MPILNGCCCCLSLRAGAILWGFFMLIISVLQTISYGITLHVVVDSYSDSQSQNNPSDVPWFSVVLIYGLCLLFVVVSALLIYGAVKRREVFLIPSLFVNGLVCVIAIFALLFDFYLVIIASPESRKQYVMYAWIVSILTSMYVYAWLLVYSLFQKLREDRHRPRHMQQYGKQPAYNPHHVHYSHVANM